MPGPVPQAPRTSPADSARTSDGRPSITSLIVPKAMPAPGAGASAVLEGRDGYNSGADAVFLSKFTLVVCIMGIPPFGRGVGGVLLVFAPGTSCTSAAATPLFGPA